MGIIEKVKERVNITDVVQAFGVKLNSKHQGLCPFHHEDTPSFSVKPEENYFKCFGCDVGGDAIKFVEKIKDVSPLEAAKILGEMFNIDVDDDKPLPQRADITSYLKRCIKDVGKTDYFSKRGLSETTIRKYSLGYDVERRSIVIPYSSKIKYYQSRSVDSKKFFKPKTEDAGPEPLYNADALYNTENAVFVVESPICALSIMQYGSQAVALCGTGNVKKLIETVKRKKPKGVLVLSLDNDDAGRKAKDELVAAFGELKIKYDVSNIAENCKDPNERLLQDSHAFAQSVQAASVKAKNKYLVGFNSISSKSLESADIPEPEWIIPDLIPEGLSVLCAASKVGKSWMAMQMCVAITYGEEFIGFKPNKCSCLYLALEDSYNRLKKRMMIELAGKRGTESFRLGIYASRIDERLFQQFDEELERYPETKFIIIDTMSMVKGKSGGRNATAYDLDYTFLAPMRSYANEHHIGILLVHHLKKGADDNDVFNLVSGSTGIMGVSDAMFIVAKKKRTDAVATMSMTGRDIKNDEIFLRFDDAKFRWSRVSTAEEEQDRAAIEDYNNNPLVRTIKHIIQGNTLWWKGTPSELSAIAINLTQRPLTAATLGKEITKVRDRLLAEGYKYTATRTGKSRYIVLQKFDPAKIGHYSSSMQQSLLPETDEYDDESDDE